MTQAVYYKYNMVRYYYSMLSMMSLGKENTLFKPLFFEFPDDPQAYNDQENNIMLGSALKLSILTNKLDQNTTSFYFPPGIWCDIINPYNDCLELNGNTGETRDLGSKAYEFGLHLRGGHIIPMQDSEALKVKTTEDLQVAPIELLVNTDSDGTGTWTANGTYLNDDGVVYNTTNKQNIYKIDFTWD